jgi:hypothetical protein
LVPFVFFESFYEKILSLVITFSLTAKAFSSALKGTEKLLVVKTENIITNVKRKIVGIKLSTEKQKSFFVRVKVV